MELGEIGKHCFLCKQIDFLPFHCSECKNYFCLLHKNRTEHDCLEQKRTLIIEKKSRKNMMFNCSLSTCGVKELQPCLCKLCNQNFCLKHRFFSDHKCAVKHTASKVHIVGKIEVKEEK